MDDDMGLAPSTSSRFNSATDILQLISLLKFEANKEYERGNLESWFFKWKSIKFQIMGKLILDAPDNLETLDKLEERINYIIERNRGSTKYNKILTRLIERYLSILQTLQQEWDMGLISKTNETQFA